MIIIIIILRGKMLRVIVKRKNASSKTWFLQIGTTTIKN